MGYIKEPKGIDFLIKSKPLTKKQELAISNYIRAFKKTQLKKSLIKKAGKKSTLNSKVVL